jgi:hypothetical protein
MAGIDLKNIKPHKVSRDLRGYSVLFYGSPKSGKTTTAAQFPKSLLLATEKGYSTLPGVMAQPINNWSEMLQALSQLKTDEIKDMFETIVIDTADIAYGYCESYVCSQNDVETIGDLPYGKGYKLVAKEFDSYIRKILNLNYGLVLISHSQDKTFKDDKGQEFNQIVPTLDTKARLICERTCDIIGYSRAVETEDGQKTMLFMRGTNRFVAGSRFKYTPDYIEFTYDNLCKAIAEAIDKQANENNNSFVTDERENRFEEKQYNFDDLMLEFQSLVADLMAKNADMYSPKITAIVENALGKGKKVGDCTEKQVEQLDTIVDELKSL